MIWYALASLFPYSLAIFAGLGIDWLAYFGVFYMALGVAGLDILLPVSPEKSGKLARGTWLNIALALVHFVAFAIGLHAVSGQSTLSGPAQIALFAMLVLIFGQISNSNAHELIHKSARLPRFLGKLVYCTLLFGHHTTAHPAIHHRYVATALDPNSPAPGQSLYSFLRQAWGGSFAKGLGVENARLAQNGHSSYSLRNPYWGYCLWSIASLTFAFLLAGGTGVLIHIGISCLATAQLLSSDYVQHYGLRRERLENGTYEAVGPQHSWNAPSTLSSRMMLNAPLHSEHHMRPSTSFQLLNRASAPRGPVLPYSLPIMASIALVPPLWRKVMARELGRLAPTNEPRVLADVYWEHPNRRQSAAE